MWPVKSFETEDFPATSGPNETPPTVVVHDLELDDPPPFQLPAPVRPDLGSSTLLLLSPRLKYQLYPGYRAISD